MVPKRQTHREMGTQSHGSVNQMRTDIQIARPPNIFLFGGFYLKKEVLPEGNASVDPRQLFSNDYQRRYSL